MHAQLCSFCGTSCSWKIVTKSQGGCSCWVGEVLCNCYKVLEGGCSCWVGEVTKYLKEAVADPTCVINSNKISYMLIIM